ncbi:hypothetical protein HN51_026092 [Arachis hypogaea]
MPTTEIIIRKTTSFTLAHDMGGTLSFNPIFNLTFSFFLVTITTTVIFIVADADDDSRESPPSFPSFQNSTNRVPSTNGISTGNSNNLNRKSQPLKPSTIIVVGVLTTLFSLTFIFLLYIKHCIHRNNENQSHQEGEPLQRNDSGIDRGVVEKLPIFRFGSLRGQKEGLDCAVCLNRFEHTDVLRLLPICNHAFHVDCVDKWFDAHSTCPLCRNRVELKDIVPREQLQEQGERDELVEDIERGTFRRVSGRHSSVLGEREGGFLEIITHNSNEKKNKKMKSSSSTRSFHSSSRSFGGFVRPRKDKTLMARQGQEGNFSNNNNRGSNAEHHRLQHQIIIDSPVASFVSSNGKGESSSSHPHHRWSEVPQSDLLYLTSEMIINDAASSVPGERRATHNHIVSNENKNNGGLKNLRSFSEVTGMSRFLGGSKGKEDGNQHSVGVATRWSAWSSRSQRPRANVQSGS